MTTRCHAVIHRNDERYPPQMSLFAPVTSEDMIDHGWGSAKLVALAAVVAGCNVRWRYDRLTRNLHPLEGTHGPHHAQ